MSAQPIVEVLEQRDEVEVVGDVVEILEADGDIDVIELDERVEVVERLDPEVVEIGISGPAGPAGSAYHHVQVSASAIWTIEHDMGFFPGGIVVKDSGGAVWIPGAITYVDTDTVILTFSASFAGHAYLS